LANLIAPLGPARHGADAVELVGGHGGRWNQGGGGWHAGMHGAGGGGGGKRRMMGYGFDNTLGRGGGSGWHAGMHGAGGGGGRR
jgi:hypothetical protein